MAGAKTEKVKEITDKREEALTVNRSSYDQGY